MEKNEHITMQSIIARLSNINKEELRERKFFQEVLSVIKDLKDLDFSEEEFEKISSTLRDIGCVDYETWEQEKEQIGFKMERRPIRLGVQDGSLSLGAQFIDSCLSDYEGAKNNIAMMLDGTEKTSMVERWLRNSQKVLVGDKKNNFDNEFEFREPALKRERREKEIAAASLKKAELEEKVSALQVEIEELKTKENKLSAYNNNEKSTGEVELEEK